ncbi:PDE12 phosphodiesterase, partial [Polypterus senegalus]
MERAVVRCVPSEPKLTISFTLDGSQRQMQRDQTEQLGRVLARIATNATKGKSKAKKSKKNRCEQTAATETVVGLYYKDEAVAEDAFNSEAWLDGSVLHVGERRYRVERNPPTFITVELPASLLAGFPVCPKVELEFGQLEHCAFQWFKEVRPNAGVEGPEDCWVEAGNERVFIPRNLDIGLHIKLKCTPGSGDRYGVSRELLSAGPVQAGPGVCTFDQRHVYTSRLTGGGTVRTVSYNILADIYAQTELSKNVLYPYCAPYALDIDYRQSLIKKELSGYNADIICLQEVDKSVFADSLVPALDAYGMEGLFKVKDKQHEGLATFYRRSRFKLLAQHDVKLSDALVSDPLHRDLLSKITDGSPAAKEKALQRSTSLQVTVLHDVNDPSRLICVANTHLYWHPKGGNIRLVQAAISLRHIQQVAMELYEHIPVIFAGDFNSTPSSGLYEFVTKGEIAESHEDWLSNGPEEQCSMSLSHALKLSSACGEPAYTNYVAGYRGCLDYIFVDSSALSIEQVIPLPSHEEVTAHQALPSLSCRNISTRFCFNSVVCLDSHDSLRKDDFPGVVGGQRTIVLHTSDSCGPGDDGPRDTTLCEQRNRPPLQPLLAASPGRR